MCCRYSTGSFAVKQTAKDENDNDNKKDQSDSDSDRETTEPTSPTSPLYNITLSPLSSEVLANTSSPFQLTGNQLPLNPPGVTQVSCASEELKNMHDLGFLVTIRNQTALIDMLRSKYTVSSLPTIKFIKTRGH